MATLEGFATQVNTHATLLSQLLAEAKLPPPSFAPDAPPGPPHGEEFEKIQAARMSLIEAAQAIRDLALGPEACITAFSDGVGPYNRSHKQAAARNSLTMNADQARSRGTAGRGRVQDPTLDPTPWRDVLRRDSRKGRLP